MGALPHFRTNLADALEGHGLALASWESGGRRSANLLQLTTSPKVTVLYVKEFNVPEKKGFWGLTRNHVDRLEKAGVRWFAVLLLRSVGAGYVLASTEVVGKINDGSFELSVDGDFKVNEDLDLAPAQRFNNLEQLLARVL